MKENRDSGVWASAQGRSGAKAEYFLVHANANNNYRHHNFFNFCLLPNQCRGGGYPPAHSFASHQHFSASGGVSPLSLAERQAAGGWHMETNNLSHLRSHLCHQLSKLFSVHPRGTHADPDLVGGVHPPLWERQ